MQRFTGPWGTITELPTGIVHPDGHAIDQTATLAHWFLSSPQAHPLWPHYLLFTAHLRDMPGQSRPPSKPRPDSSHNIMLLALNPALAPWTAENFIEKMLAPRTESAYLTPLNASEFISNATDEQAIELTTLLARALVEGHVPIECDDFIGGRQRWKTVIAATMEHLRFGGHPSRDN